MATVQELLARARSAAGKKVKYKLGGGGVRPSSALPSNVDGECDCSGYVCWALGLSRQTDHPLYVRFNQGWINTDAIVHDAKKETGFFTELAEPRPGCVVVYGAKQGRKVGHVGIVTEVDASSGNAVATKVLHCSSGNYRRNGDAICETDLGVFKTPDAIYAWYEGID